MSQQSLAAPNAQRLVEDFLGSWQAGDIDRIMSFFAPDAVYHNVPVDPIAGTAGIRTIFESFLELFEDANLEVIRIAASQDLVLAERVDRFRMRNGKSFDLPVTGVFELEGGKIKRFSDYFDLSSFEKASGLKL